MGIFGNLFDFNNDGKLDAFKMGMELGFLTEMMENTDSDKKSEED